MQSSTGHSPSGGSDHATRSGVVLVAIQAVLFVAVGLWPSSWGPSLAAHRTLGAVLVVLGAAGMVVAGRALGASLTPLPDSNGRGLRTRGVYRWVRHPMYSAIVVVALGVACARGAWVVWGVVVVLALFFDLKTRREEMTLVRTYPGYADYASATGKFIPGLGKRRRRR